MKGVSRESSFNCDFLGIFNVIFVKGIRSVVCKDSPSVSWDSCDTITDVDVGITVNVEQVDDSVVWNMLEGHIIKYDSIVVWMQVFEFVDVADEEGIFEMGKRKLCFAKS